MTTSPPKTAEQAEVERQAALRMERANWHNAEDERLRRELRARDAEVARLRTAAGVLLDDLLERVADGARFNPGTTHAMEAVCAALAAVPAAPQLEGAGHVACPQCAYEWDDNLIAAAVNEAVEAAAPPQMTDEEIRRWLDDNTMFYDVDHSYTFAEIEAMPNVPVLASVSRRIWYHATDDVESSPFSEVVRRALLATPPTRKLPCQDLSNDPPDAF